MDGQVGFKIDLKQLAKSSETCIGSVINWLSILSRK
jgi:hypothetical protein